MRASPASCRSLRPRAPHCLPAIAHSTTRPGGAGGLGRHARRGRASHGLQLPRGGAVAARRLA
eukprot:10267667-Alexandrium_andersonii.AAC.1